ncbi:MAG: tetratricopeptide repeat protein [Bacteroidales bacterium]|nr:tetratricopeptide repeat protein [Bacteroidales bacterium]
MAKTSNHSTGDDNLVAIQSSLSKTEHFIEENQKSISIIIAAIVFIVVGYLAYQKFYVAPQEEEAQSKIFLAQNYFAMDSFKLALKGDGNFVDGFEDIADDYGMTNVGSLANYYAGLCYLQLGDYDSAIDYLKKFDANDEMITTMALGAIGDAYVQKDDVEEAVSYFKKAIERKPNEFSTPLYLFKLGLAYENLGKKDDAREAYEKIKTEYPKSNEARKIDKYLARLNF